MIYPSTHGFPVWRIPKGKSYEFIADERCIIFHARNDKREKKFLAITIGLSQ